MENKNKLNKIHLLLLCTIFLVLFCNIYSYGYGHGRGGYGGRGGHQKKEVIEKKDLYKILDLTRRAGKDDIKKNYRKLTREYHPDRNPDFREKFQDISEAYEILSDRKKRRIYDLKGYHGYKESVKNEGQNNQHQMMGGMFGMMGGQQKDKLEDLNIKLKVSLADLYNGKELNFKYTRNTICPHCRGTGGESEDDVAPCKKCSGSGWTMETHQIAPGYVQQFQKPCPKCAGKGQIITTQCHICGGVKLHPSIEEMSVFVEKGMKNGQKIVS
jgi:DnaJ-related protein SCJ1